MAHGQGGAEIGINHAPTLTCNHEAPIAAYPILEIGKRTGVSTKDPRAGLGIGNDGDPMFTLQASAQHGVALSVALRGRDGGTTAELGDDIAGTLRAGGGGGDKAHVLAPIAFDTTQITSPDNHSNPQPGQPCHPLASSAHAPCIAFSLKDYGGDASVNLAPTLRAGNHHASHASHANGGQPPAIAYRIHSDNSNAMRGSGNANVADQTDVARCLDTTGGFTSGQGGNVVMQPMTYRDAMGLEHWPDDDDPVYITGDVAHTLKAEGFDASEDGTGRGQPIVFQPRYYSDRVRMGDEPSDVCHTLSAQSGQGDSSPHIATAMAVRRLIPRECERLQGMRDDYTLIPTKKAKKRSKKYSYVEIDGQLWQLAADGPRYKSLGNSMAVPNMRWLGRRIDAALRTRDTT